MRRICGKQPEGTLLGCARRPVSGELPFVALADEATARANGWTPNLNSLHEAGHLNGSWGHEGWRDLAQMGAPAAATPRPTKPMPEPKTTVVAQADAADGSAMEDSAGYEFSPPPRRRPP